MSEPAKPIPRASFVRPATAVLFVATLSCVTECSEGDGHLSTTLGAGSHWLDLHAMPAVWMLYFPDGLALMTEHLLAMIGIAVVTLALFAAFERFGLGPLPWHMTWITWAASWAGTLLPLPFLFLGFFAQFFLVPMIGIGVILAVIAKRRTRPAG